MLRMWFYIRIRPWIFDFWVLIFFIWKICDFLGYWIRHWSKKSFFLMQRLPISYNWISETFHILFHDIFGLEVVFFPNLEIYVKIAHYEYLSRNVKSFMFFKLSTQEQLHSSGNWFGTCLDVRNDQIGQ